MVGFVKRFIGDERGATAIEYALITGLIFVTIVGALYAFSDGILALFTRISDAVKG